MRQLMTVCVCVLLLGACGDDGGNNGSTDARTTSDATLNGADASAEDDRTIVQMVTTKGTMVLELFPQHMPITTANFLAYVDASWYDDTLIHRVVDDWVIQGGGWTSGLRNKTPNAPINLETSTMVSHIHGAISMARTAQPNTATSQWFIVDSPAGGTPPQPGELDGQYAAFGVIIEGLDVLAMITQVATQTTTTMGSPGSLDDVPVEEILVTSITRR